MSLAVPANKTRYSVCKHAPWLLLGPTRGGEDLHPFAWAHRASEDLHPFVWARNGGVDLYPKVALKLCRPKLTLT